MSQRPWDYNNDIQPGTETISHESKLKLIGLNYEGWLKEEQRKGLYNASISHYHPSTVKEFLIYYRVSEQNEWNIARYGSENQVSEFRFRGQGYEALDGSTYAEYNILSAFENDNNSDIRRFNNTQLKSFISGVYADKNRTFDDVNKVDSHREGLWKKFLSKISHFFQTREINSGPLRQAPRASQDAQSLGRTQSMQFNYRSPSKEAQSFKDDPKKRRRSDQQPSGTAQGDHKRTRSAPSLTYYEAYSGGDRNEILEAEDARFEREIKFQKMKEAKRKEREEAKKPRQPQRASSFPSPSANPQPLIDPRTRKLGSTSRINSSPFTRGIEQGVGNRRPRPAPRQPLSAKPASSKGVGASPSGRY